MVHKTTKDIFTRSYPNLKDEYDLEEVKTLKAKDWQLALLKRNPSYTCWGNYEDYMSNKDAGWASAHELETFKEHFELDELNELVNFYFEVYRKGHSYPHCEGSALNVATKQISDDWYAFDNPRYIDVDSNRRFNDNAWSHHITDDEVFELIKHGRLGDLTDYRGHFDEEKQKWMGWVDGKRIKIAAPRPNQIPTAEKVNHWSAYERGFGHDSINQWICVKQRAIRLGVYGSCEHCEEGVIYDESEARVALQLWMLHPRKGCSRGVYIKNIEENEVPEVLEFLRGAAKRNAKRFSKLK